MFSSSLPPVVCRRAYALFTLLCLYAFSGVLHLLCCVCVLFSFRSVYPRLPVSHECSCLISPWGYSLTFINYLGSLQFCNGSLDLKQINIFTDRIFRGIHISSDQQANDIFVDYINRVPERQTFLILCLGSDIIRCDKPM